MKQNTDTKQKNAEGGTPKSFNIYDPYEKDGESNTDKASSRGRYLLTPTSRETNTLSSMYISSQLSFNFGEVEKIKKNGVQFYMVGMSKKSITATTQKVYNLIRQKIADQVRIGSKVKENVRIFIRADEYLSLAGKDPSNQTLIYNTNKKLKKALETLSCIKFIAKDEQGKEIRVPLEGGVGISDPVNGSFLFTASSDYVSSLNLARYTPQAYFELPEDNPLPCYLYDKLSYHYGMDINVHRGTRNIISLESLLDYLEDVLPTFKALNDKGERHYRERIKQPLERALHSLEAKKLISWDYVGERRKHLTDEEKAKICVDEEYTYKCFLQFELTDKELLDEARRRKAISSRREQAQVEDAPVLSDEQFVKEFGSLLEESSCK